MLQLFSANSIFFLAAVLDSSCRGSFVEFRFVAFSFLRLIGAGAFAWGDYGPDPPDVLFVGEKRVPLFPGAEAGRVGKPANNCTRCSPTVREKISVKAAVTRSMTRHTQRSRPL